MKSVKGQMGVFHDEGITHVCAKDTLTNKQRSLMYRLAH